MKIQTLKEQLLKLHLSGMEGILDETLKKAATDNLSPADALTILAEHEIAQQRTQHRPVVGARQVEVGQVVHGASPRASCSAIAVKAGLTKAQFDETVALHPTMAEELVLMK